LRKSLDEGSKCFDVLHGFCVYLSFLLSFISFVSSPAIIIFYVFLSQIIVSTFSKRPTTTFMALTANNNEPTTNFVYHRVHNSPLNSTTTSPRRSWSTLTFNNKNFPDGKLSYESQQLGGGVIGGGSSGSVSGSWKINDVTNEMARARDSGKERQDVMARASQIVM